MVPQESQSPPVGPMRKNLTISPPHTPQVVDDYDDNDESSLVEASSTEAQGL